MNWMPEGERGRQNVQQALDHHFRNLDASVGSGVYALPLSPEQYETWWWHAFERLNAMFYHQGNALRLIVEALQSSRKAPRIAKNARIKSTSFTQLRTDERLTFELIAFLAAAKSCADFVSTVIASYYGQTSLDSVRKLLQHARQRSGPIRDLCDRHAETLEQLQLYRNTLLHRTSMRIHVKTVEKTEEGRIRGTTMAIVGKEPPKPGLVTRRTMQEAAEPGFGEATQGATYRYSDGTTRLARFEFQLMPPIGFDSVHDFLAIWLDRLGAFMLDSGETLGGLKFDPGGA